MFYKAIFIFLLAILLSSCDSDFDWRFNRLSDYGQEFVKEFGWPNELQDWNTTIQYQITADIDVEGTWTMKVYTADPIIEPEKSYLIGQFEVSASDSVTVKVDGPYTLESICIGIENGSNWARKNVEMTEDGNIAVSFEKKEIQIGNLPSAEKMSYFLAYEVVDSTSTYLDFNDVVLEVIHVSGEETADIKIRAIGAKEKMSVSYLNNDEKTTLFDNVHSVFGYHDTEQLVNVELDEHDYRTPMRYKNLNVGNDFSMANDAGRFIVSVENGKKSLDFYLKPATEYNLGTPTNVLVIANPTWDWLSEGNSFDIKSSSFSYWLKSYRLYNQWWDTLWDPNELIINDDGSYSPDFNYTDMIFGYQDLKDLGNVTPDIDYQRLKSYKDEEVGANIGFVITNRNGGAISIQLARSDSGTFEWYGDNAYVNVEDNSGIDAGRGYAEACHILISTKTIKDIIKNKATLKVKFDPKDTEASINSVWVRGR